MKLSRFLRDILLGCVKPVWKCVCMGVCEKLGVGRVGRQELVATATRKNHTVASKLLHKVVTPFSLLSWEVEACLLQ